MEKVQESKVTTPEKPIVQTQIAKKEFVPATHGPKEPTRKDLQKIEDLRRELGLESSTPISLLEGISLDNFDTGRLEILRAFYKNRETRENVINTDLHLRGYDRAITKIESYFRDLQGKPPLTKNIEVTGGSKLETKEDFSLHYFDVQHEVQPVYNEIEKSVHEFISAPQTENKNISVVIEKKDYQTFVKKVSIDGKVIQEIDIGIEPNSLWQALKRGKFEMNVTTDDTPINFNGGGGGESVGIWAKVTSGRSNLQNALKELESLSIHEYTHVNQVATLPKDQGVSSTFNYKNHATHPTEIQARVHEAIHFARKNQTDFNSALTLVMDNYFERSKDKILKEGAEDVVKNQAPKLHQEYFEKHYAQVRELYPGL